jgi:hypothetical protein
MLKDKIKIKKSIEKRQQKKNQLESTRFYPSNP